MRFKHPELGCVGVAKGGGTYTQLAVAGHVPHWKGGLAQSRTSAQPHGEIGSPGS